MTTLAGTGLLVVADKTDDGGAVGKVAAESAAFMRTRHGDDYAAVPPDVGRLWENAQHAEGERVTTGRYPVMRVTSTWEVRSTLELTVPGIEHRMTVSDYGARTAYMLHPDGSWARAAAAGRRALPEVHHGGPRRLWDELDRIGTWLVVDGDLPVPGAQVVALFTSSDSAYSRLGEAPCGRQRRCSRDRTAPCTSRAAAGRPPSAHDTLAPSPSSPPPRNARPVQKGRPTTF